MRDRLGQASSNEISRCLIPIYCEILRLARCPCDLYRRFIIFPNALGARIFITLFCFALFFSLFIGIVNGSFEIRLYDENN